MTKEERIRGFVELKKNLDNFSPSKYSAICREAKVKNAWFTEQNITLALSGIGRFLDPHSLENWLEKYSLPVSSKDVGIVMAGNIPLVGFHDFLCVIMSGSRAVIKLSSQDNILLPAILDLLLKIDPQFSQQIHIVDKLSKVDAVIATGSDNSARYFKKYFGANPHIIRQNRTSVAVLSGTESTEEIEQLGLDIFSYFGLGCRNVAKLYIPAGYDLTKMFQTIEKYHDIINHNKYFNNYEYNKAIFLVNRVEHYDNGFVLFTENKALSSPLSVIYYEYYNNLNDLKGTLEDNLDKIQCIVSKIDLDLARVRFGQSQFPGIDDYADNIDTMKFLCELR